MTTMGSLALAMLLIARVRPQAMGDGVSKYTLPCNAPEAPMQWMEKYLPVITSSDSCEGAADDWLGVDNDCVCSTANETLETVAQGRVQLYGDRGFGLHLVNTSFKLTTGGLSVAAVEAVFEERLNDMAHFDAYMDYSVAFYAPPTGPRALDAFVEAFDADNVSYYPYRWTNGTSGNASTFYGLFVHVPASMLVIELMSNASAGVPRRVPRDREISDARADYLANQTLKVVSVSRATVGIPASRECFFGRGRSSAFVAPRGATVRRAPQADLDAMVAFYGALNVSTTYAYDAPEVRKACFVWWSADVEVCYAERSEITSFYTVADFEAMLNAVHADLLGPNPNCQLDKRAAASLRAAVVEDGRVVYEYLAAHNATYYAATASSSTSRAYSLSTCSDDDWDWDDVDEYHFACEALANETARVVAVSIASSSSKKKSKKADVFGVPVGDFVAEVLVAFVISAAVAVGLVWYRRASQLAGRGYVRIPWVEKEAPYSSKSAS
ncbi:hypothetical protein SO694_00019345 [Aureococcus anophagefferens]|uniref:Uncharacterized protein n=1 Tax=Aureococcus anophagefferens TaxID=44056 RepID=A0ABR1G034_AURAN